MLTVASGAITCGGVLCNAGALGKISSLAVWIEGDTSDIGGGALLEMLGLALSVKPIFGVVSIWDGVFCNVGAL